MPGNPLRILIAPDKFKGTLTARQAAGAMAEGARRAAMKLGIAIEPDLCPLADGGEGTIDALIASTGSTIRRATVAGPRGEPRDAEWLELPRAGHRAAVIESANACGLMLVPDAERNPERTTSFGVGELIRAAIGRGCKEILVGLGGSATTDGGAGLAQALGAAFDPPPAAPLTGADLPRLARVRPAPIPPGVTIVALCDVTNPLLGPDGAARVFAPQKGASPEQVERLERGLMNLARCCREAGIAADPNAPGAGAAGGMGFGLAALAGARLARGINIIMDLLDFDARAHAAGLILTGEGRLDRQSLGGKAVRGVAERAAALGRAPVIAIAGQIEEPRERLLNSFRAAGAPLLAAGSLDDSPSEMPDDRAAAAGARLAARTERAVVDFLLQRR